MNNLSWFIYLADVLSDLDGVFFFFATVSGLFGGVAVFVTCMIAIEGYGDEQDMWLRRMTTASVSLVITMIVSIIISVIIPSKTTFYAIAASEMGEQLIKTPTANKAMKALDAWLDKQIDETKTDDADE